MPDTIRTSTATLDAPATTGAVRIDGVTKRYGAATAVDDLSLDVQPGSSSRSSGPPAAARRRPCA